MRILAVDVHLVKGKVVIVGKVIGHRGAAAYAPENTLAAFNKALSLGCQMIEFDVMCSADGKPFIFHDENLKRTSNGRGLFGLVDSAYINSLDAGSWFASEFKGEKILSLKEAIQWLVFTNLHANIEIKPFPKTESATTITILEQIQRFWPRNKPLPLLSSFSWEVLLLCKSIAPEMPLALLLHTWDPDWLAKAEQIDCYSIHLCARIATPKRIAAMKAAGFKVAVYTVNKKKAASKLLALGADAVFSDYPDLLA